MLAMDVNDNAGSLTPSGVPASIASMLAPTGDSGQQSAGRAFCRRICRNSRCFTPHIPPISIYAHPGA